jgi:putative transposase
MPTHSIAWPHAPPHRLSDTGTYIVTCGTYRKQHFLNSPEKLSLIRNLLFELAQKQDWQLQAWAIMSNHYHFVASSPGNPASLKTMLSALHTLSARDLNRIDEKPGRKVWYNYFDSRITYEKSWLACLNYVNHNPVHHGVVQNAELYEWCSAAWFARESSPAFVKTVNSFKIDQVKVYDDYMECAGSTALSNTRALQSGSAAI